MNNGFRRHGDAMPLRAFLALCVWIELCGFSWSQDVTASDLDVAIFEEDYCTSKPSASKGPTTAELSTHLMPCSNLMEFVYISRLKVWEHLGGLKAASAGGDRDQLTWRAALNTLSEGSSVISAHVHIIAAVASQRAECFSEHVRLLLVVNLRRLKALATAQIKQLWLLGQDGPGQIDELLRELRDWLTEAVELLDADLRTMRTVFRSWQLPAPDETRFYSHEADGRFSTMEALRRDTFEEWQLDRGLLQGLLRHVLPVDASVADFGAGSGHYARWLNDTGLVTAFAFDGSPDMELVTKGSVIAANLGTPITLWRRFDWTMCIDVAEHIPPEFTAVFLQNLDAHTMQGLVLSWPQPSIPGVGQANPQREADVLELVRQHTGLHFDADLTSKVRMAASVAHLAESLFVFVREERQSSCSATGSCGVESASGPGCGMEDGWIYAGNDVQMFSDIKSPAACCDLCNSNDMCRFWTWSREETHKDLCWIKATREYRINHAGFISGTRTTTA